MTTISHHLRLVHDRINAACRAAGRDPAGVRLLAVSKTFGADAVIAAVRAGQLAFGENYIAEGVEKITALRRWQEGESARADVAASALEWHCIGPLQSNKTRPVAEHFDWVQSVDRLKIAQRLSEQRPADCHHCKSVCRSTSMLAPTSPVWRPKRCRRWPKRSRSCRAWRFEA
jgi:pyridoxal phosphate enzyme (YggS family)